MIVTRSFMDQTWTDLSSPTKEELDSLMFSQNIDPLIAKDLLAPTPKQYVKEFDNVLYMVMHIPSFKHAKPESSEHEIDFVITEKSLVTTRYDSIDALHHFAKQVEVAEVLNKENHSHLFFGLMKEVYKFLFDEVEYMQDWIKEIEKKIFEGHEKEMVLGISTAGKNILTFKRIINPHQTVLENLISLGKNNFSDKFERDARLLLEEWARLSALIEDISDILDELRETNNSLLSTKQNEIMKIFTIMAFVTFPLSLIASIFGMNTSFIPIVGLHNDFWIIIAIMFVISLAMFTFFKYKKWI